MAAAAKTRDPRLDPQAGDHIQKEGRRDVPLERIVLSRKHEAVQYKSSTTGKVRTIFITNWNDWARDATVINTAPI